MKSHILLFLPFGLFVLANAGCKKDETEATTKATTEKAEEVGSTTTGQSATVEYRNAQADLLSREGKDIEGWVKFAQEVGSDKVVITAQVKGLAPGKHGFHVHEKGDCSAKDFTSAGGHFAPDGNPHGAPGPDSHAGDLGNIDVSEEDAVTLYRIETSDLTLEDGENSVLGKAVVIHEKEDDLKSQPTGAAGGRLACGVIKATTPSPAPEVEKAP